MELSSPESPTVPGDAGGGAGAGDGFELRAGDGADGAFAFHCRGFAFDFLHEFALSTEESGIPRLASFDAIAVEIPSALAISPVPMKVKGESKVNTLKNDERNSKPHDRSKPRRLLTTPGCRGGGLAVAAGVGIGRRSCKASASILVRCFRYSADPVAALSV